MHNILLFFTLSSYFVKTIGIQTLIKVIKYLKMLNLQHFFRMWWKFSIISVILPNLRSFQLLMMLDNSSLLHTACTYLFKSVSWIREGSCHTWICVVCPICCVVIVLLLLPISHYVYNYNWRKCRSFEATNPPAFNNKLYIELGVCT